MSVNLMFIYHSLGQWLFGNLTFIDLFFHCSLSRVQIWNTLYMKFCFNLKKIFLLLKMYTSFKQTYSTLGNMIYICSCRCIFQKIGKWLKNTTFFPLKHSMLWIFEIKQTLIDIFRAKWWQTINSLISDFKFEQKETGCKYNGLKN